MPELPEVETVRRILQDSIVNQKITSLEVIYKRSLPSSLEAFEKAIIGTTITSVGRVGKFLLFYLSSNQVIVSHLRMEGKYYFYKEDQPLTSHTSFCYHFQSGFKLLFDDTRKFGVTYLIDKSELYDVPPLNNVGPEPFFIKDPKTLYASYQKLKRPLKEVLLDQSLMAGLGNIYADEVAFASSLNPFIKVNKLTLEEVNSIIKNSIKVLNKAINLGGSTIRSYHPSEGVSGRFQNELQVYGHEGELCSICHHKILKRYVKGRGTAFCPVCQKVAPTIGITGPIGSGKSTIMDEFLKAGFKIFSADAEVKKLYASLPFNKLLAKSLDLSLDFEGFVSKVEIQERMISSTNFKKKLELIIHPLIKDKLMSFLNDNSESLIAAEIPLLFEAHLDSLFEFTLGIDIDLDKQLRNLEVRFDKEPQKRVQMNGNSFYKYQDRCNFIITNNGTLTNLIEESHKIIVNLQAIMMTRTR